MEEPEDSDKPYNLGKRILKDEIEWVEKETKFIDKILPVISNKLFLKFILTIFILFILFRFYKVFTTILFVLITSYIRFKREKMGIPIEIEPTYLFAIVLTLAFDLRFGFLFIFIPVFVTVFIKGVSGSLIVNIWNKIIVLLGVYFFWYFFPNIKYIIWVAIGLVIITDLIGYKLRLKVGQPVHEIIMTLATNSVLRFTYFSILLELLITIL